MNFFKKQIGKKNRDNNIPEKFIKSLVNWYDYEVLSEVKEALYFYNKKQISEDILNYLSAVNYDIGNKIKCKYTGKSLEVTIEFFKEIGSYIAGEQLSDDGASEFADHIQQRYVEMVAQDQQKDMTETELYKELFDSYVKNLKERALQPFIENENFREAVKSYETEEFNAFDSRLQKHVSSMIKNLIKKFGYTEQGAKEICLYVIDKELVEKFS